MRNEWLTRRLESIFDNLIFAAIMGGGAAVIAALKSLPLTYLIGISVGIFIFILILIRIVVNIYKPLGLFSIIPILHKKEKYIIQLSNKPERILLDSESLYDSNGNFTILNQTFSKNSDIPTMRKQFQDARPAIESVFEGDDALRNFLNMLIDLDTMLSVVTPNLASILKNDKHLKKYSKYIEDYYDKFSYVINPNLDELLKLHQLSCDIMFNLFILSRFLKYNPEYAEVFPMDIKAHMLGDPEILLNSAMKKIRINIAESIRQLEKSNNKNKTKNNESTSTYK